MKSIEEAAKEYAKLEYEDLYDEDSLDVDITIKDFTKGVEFAQRWYSMNELKPLCIPLLFKNENKYSCGTFEMIEGKLAIATDLGYSIMEDSGFTHWRPIEYK